MRRASVLLQYAAAGYGNNNSSNNNNNRYSNSNSSGSSSNAAAAGTYYGPSFSSSHADHGSHYSFPRAGGGGGGSGGSNNSNIHHLRPSAFVEPLPLNTFINIVPQGREYVVERLGKYHKTLTSGLWVTIPILDKIRYNYNVKEQGIEIPNQSAITSDNVMVDIDGVLFLRIVDSFKASYNIENPIYNLINLAQTTMRSEIGTMDLDSLFRERASLNKSIVDVLRKEASDWGIECKRYEIRDISVSEIVRRSMDLQAEAERHKRKVILESEGAAAAEVNRAEALRRAQQLSADGARYAIVQQAEADASAVTIKAEATKTSLTTVAEALARTSGNGGGGEAALALRVAENYIDAFGRLAKETNTVVLSQPVSDPATFSAQALSIFNSVATSANKAAAAAGAGSGAAAGTAATGTLPRL